MTSGASKVFTGGSGRRSASGFFKRFRAKAVLRIRRTLSYTRVRIKKLPASRGLALVGKFISRAAELVLRAIYSVLLVLCSAVLACAAPARRVGSFFSAVGTRISSAFHSAGDVMRRVRKNSRAFLVVSMLTLAVVIISVNFLSVGLEVVVNGRVLGRVENQEQFEKIVSSVETRAAGYLGRPFVLGADVRYRFSFFDLKNEIDEEAVSRYLFSTIEEITVSQVLRVDGEIIGANASRTAIEMILERIMGDYQKYDESSELAFVQDIEITEEPIASTYMMSVEDIEAALRAPVSKQTDYTVQRGDTLLKLARRFDMSVDEIKSLNPEISESSLIAGQTIITSREASMLSIEEVRQISYNEAIPFETVVEKNDAMYTNQTKVITRGQNGEKLVTARVTCIDGVEKDREILSEEVITEPVTQVEHVGTKKPPAKSPTGKFIRPYGGRITSNYGYRHGEFHTGVDFAGPAGGAIVASDGGTVKFAGRNGNYGKCVIISHGNGIETLYAHCSALYVKVGQQVAKGEKIAAVGSTGRSTGPHCHFEVRVNGKHVSPWKYIS